MLQRLVVLCCDGCGRWSHAAGFSTAELARKDAKRQGWILNNGDRCAKCVRRAQER